MDDHFDLLRFLCDEQAINAANRPIRLHLEHLDGVSDQVLLPQRVYGREQVCGAMEYRILCVSLEAKLPLKQFIALPAALEFVTDRGQLRRICGLVTSVSAGDSDGGLATYQIIVRDALAVMEKRINTRVFRNMNEYDIVCTLISEWRRSNVVLAHALEDEADELFTARTDPKRAFTMQYNESDAHFIRRLLRRRGIAWYFRAGHSRATPADAHQPDAMTHTLVMLNHPDSLRRNAAGTVRYHRDDATEQRDTITRWGALRTLQAGSASLHSWNYKAPHGTQFMAVDAQGKNDQGPSGNALAASLNDYRFLAPHAAADCEDLHWLGQLRMARRDYETKCFIGEGSVRDFCAGEVFTLEGHPEIDAHPAEERDFVITELQIRAQNNLPASLTNRLDSMFARNGWMGQDDPAMLAPASDEARNRMHVAFTAVRAGTPIVPSFDPAVDVPHAPMMSALVVGPAGEEVYCDELGRVKVRFPGMRATDHAHAQGSGAANGPDDSAWIRVASGWAGNGPGSQNQCGTLSLPRVGTEVLVAFLGGDPDKPVIVGQLYNRQGLPPALSTRGDLPGNRHLSGIRSREIKGSRANQLRFDDTNGRINAQLASDHGASQLNLGWLTQPLAQGQGEGRGEGAELRSDQAVAVRGAQGVLISTERQPNAAGAMLDREELLGLTEGLQNLCKQLTELAQPQLGAQAGSPDLAVLLERLKHWHAGSNVKDKAGGTGGQPIIAAHARSGMLLGSQDGILIGAQSRVDIASVGDTQVSTGGSLFARAARGIHQIAFKLGIKLIAAGGDVRVQANDGDIEIFSQKRIRLVAAKGIDLEAPEIKLAAQGAQANYGAGEIVQQSKGQHTIKSSVFDHLDGGDGTPAALKLQPTKAEHDQRIRLTDMMTGDVAAGRRYRLTTEDGSVIEGVSDKNGLTEAIPTALAYARCTFELLD